MTAIFIFHRDLRLVDNHALQSICSVAERVIPIFVFTPEQVEPRRNPYYNSNAVQFMCESLEELNEACHNRLAIFYGDLIDVLGEIRRGIDNIQYISFNQDYTPYAKARTERVRRFAEKHGITLSTAEDYTLVNMDNVRGGDMYSVFRPYYERVRTMKISVTKQSPNIMRKLHKYGNKSSRLTIPIARISRFYKPNEYVQVGGRREGLRQLAGIGKFKRYSQTRNTPSVDTTQLSAHIKFGTVSIREVYARFVKVSSELTRQLIWHDFYAQVMYYLPHRQTLGGGNFQNKKERKWSSSQSSFEKWCTGRTGVPIIDAGMRQLNTIGWMHNRVRLLVSNYLVFKLGINWRKGERYFAQKLVDYDPSSNNGNWQFSAQVGVDRQPYTRIYNPFKQARDIDPDATYIRRWVQELRGVDTQTILHWDTVDAEEKKRIGYPE